MATPTLVSSDPAVVWTGGQMVTLTGTNFRTATIPSYYLAGPYPPPKPSVSVKADGAAATNVRVMSSTLLTCILPAHDTGAATITVQNLDDDGAPIPGESTVVAAAVTFERPDLAAEPDWLLVNRRLVQMLKQQIIENVSNFVGVDWSEAPFEAAAVATLPALTIGLPDVTRSSPWRQTSEFQASTSATAFEQHRAPERVNLEYTLTGVTDDETSWFALHDAVQGFFKRNGFVTLERDPNDSSKGIVSYPLRVLLDTPVKNTTSPNKDNIRAFTVPFVVQGVLRESIVSFPGEDVQGTGGTAEAIVLTSSRI